MGNQKIFLKLDQNPSMPISKIDGPMLATISVHAHKAIIHALWDNTASPKTIHLSHGIIK